MKAKNNRKKKKGHLLFGLTARALMLVAAAGLMASYLSMFVNPAKLWLATLAGLVFFPFFLLNVFLLVWAVVRRSRSVIIPFIVLVPAFFLAGRFIQTGGAGAKDGDVPVKMVSYNVGRFMQSSRLSGVKSSGECRDSIFSWLKKTDADVICLQEYYCESSDALKKAMKKNFPKYNCEYYINRQTKGLCGNVILSRFPVTGKGKFDFENSSNLAFYADVKMPTRTVRVYNCHFESYNISISRLSETWGRDTALVHEAEAKMRRSLSLRPKQVDEIMKSMKSSPVESVVVGDFNDNPISYTYQALRRSHKDSFVEAGKGLGGTFSLLWPFLRIDYILFPDDCRGTYHKVTRLKYSDHYPVTADVVF